MAISFSNVELCDMHLTYGLADCNRAEARRLYIERFPNRRVPSEMTFVNVHHRLRENGSFVPNLHDTGRSLTTRTLQVEERVLQRVEENPLTSTRRISSIEGIDHSSVWRVLRQNQLYPYHVQRAQALLECDYGNRLAFCQQLLRKSVRNPNFISFILFTDEAGFNRHGILNFHNTHHWAEDNPHLIVQSRHQHNFSLNIWAGIIGDNLIGPVFLPARLNGEVYLHFLEHELSNYLDEVPLATRNCMWFMHDGAPAHFCRNVRNYLDEKYRNRWIGRGGPITWPARSPDFNPLDYFVWGHLKSIVYSHPVDNVDQLRERITDGFRQIRAMPGVFERVRQSLARRLEQSVVVSGGHVEHLL